MWKDKEVKQNIPIDKTFEFEVDLSNKDNVTKIVNKLLKVKKDVTEITFEGDLIEGGALITATEDDIPEDIKDLIDMGLYSMEEALAKCAENTSKEKRMVIRKPTIKMVGEDGKKEAVIQKIESRYEEENLILDFMLEDDPDEDEEENEDIPFDLDDDFDDDSGSNDSWLDQL